MLICCEYSRHCKYYCVQYFTLLSQWDDYKTSCQKPVCFVVWVEHAKLCMQIYNTWWTLALEHLMMKAATFKDLKPTRRLNLSRQCDDWRVCDDWTRVKSYTSFCSFCKTSILDENADDLMNYHCGNSWKFLDVGLSSSMWGPATPHVLPILGPLVLTWKGSSISV